MSRWSRAIPMIFAASLAGCMDFGANDTDELESATILGRVDAGIVEVSASPFDDPGLLEQVRVGADGVFEIELPLRDGPVLLRAVDDAGVELYTALLDTLQSDDGIVFAPPFGEESRLEHQLFLAVRELGRPATIDTIDLRDQIGPLLTSAFLQVHPRERQLALNQLAVALADRQFTQSELAGLLMGPDEIADVLRAARAEPAQRVNEGLFNGEGIELLLELYSEDVSLGLEGFGVDLHEQVDLNLHGVRQAHVSLVRLKNRWPGLYESMVVESNVEHARSFTRSLMQSLRAAGATETELVEVRRLFERMLLDLRLADSEGEIDHAFDAFRVGLLYHEGRDAFLRLVDLGDRREGEVLKNLMHIARDEAIRFDEGLREQLSPEMALEDRTRVGRELYGDLRLGIELEIEERLPGLAYDPELIGVLARIAALWAPERTRGFFPFTKVEG